MDKGANIVYIEGVFQNVAENITIPENRDIFIVYGRNALIVNSTLEIKPCDTSSSSIMMDNIILQNTVLILENIAVEFLNCTLNDVFIHNAQSSVNEISNQLQITMKECIFWCSGNSEKPSYGLLLIGMVVVRMHILETTVTSCRFNIFAYNLMLSIMKSIFINISSQIQVNSFLRVPSIILLQNSNFSNIGSTGKEQAVSLELYNPYIFIDNCLFNMTSLLIASYFNQDLFYIQIVRSYFINAQKEGNGGALFFSSGVKNSKVNLTGVAFIENRSSRGKGGALFVEGDMMHMTIEDSVFINNLADDLGTALFVSKGIEISIKNVSFKMEFRMPSPQPLAIIHGMVITLIAIFKVENRYPHLFSSGAKVLIMEELSANLLISVHCPIWYKHVIEYQTGNTEKDNQMINNNITQPMKRFMYECGICPDRSYALAEEYKTLSYPQNISHQKSVFQANQKCILCPYGAFCSGNMVIPRPNFWGFWYRGKLEFQQCPSGYCCSGSNSASCKKYNSCVGNRTGTLCGACTAGFSVGILSGECIPNKQCGKDQWFWLLAVLAAIAYAFWYTLKEDMLRLLVLSIIIFSERFKRLVKFFQTRRYDVPPLPGNEIIRSQVKRAAVKADCPLKQDDNCPTRKDYDFNPLCSADGTDKGYFGIVTYFVQMAAAMKVHIEFSNSNKGKSVLETMVKYMEASLNFELTSLSFNVCPILGLTTAGKHLYKIIFLLGVYIAWVGIMIVTGIVLNLSKNRKCRNKLILYVHSFKIKLVKGIIEIIKYTYSGFCGVVFTSLVCTNVASRSVWFYDGTIVCMSRWQILMILFGLFYSIPLPFVMVLAMKCLNQNRMTPVTFILCCVCPPIALCFLLVNKVKSKRKESTGHADDFPLSESSEAIISVLQGPYRASEENSHMTLYWEAMICIRRLLITAMTLIPFGSIKMTILTALCIIFLYQHCCIFPFHLRKSNHVEGLSLSLLLANSVINLLKACLTDAGVVPSGPLVPFFKSLELCEKLFVFIIISYILYIELNISKRIHGHKTESGGTTLSEKCKVKKSIESDNCIMSTYL